MMMIKWHVKIWSSHTLHFWIKLTICVLVETHRLLIRTEANEVLNAKKEELRGEKKMWK